MSTSTKVSVGPTKSMRIGRHFRERRGGGLGTFKIDNKNGDDYENSY